MLLCATYDSVPRIETIISCMHVYAVKFFNTLTKEYFMSYTVYGADGNFYKVDNAAAKVLSTKETQTQAKEFSSLNDNNIDDMDSSTTAIKMDDMASSTTAIHMNDMDSSTTAIHMDDIANSTTAIQLDDMASSTTAVQA